MPTVNKLWTFASSDEGWTGVTSVDGSFTYAGTITPPSGEDITADSQALSPAGTTWLNLGVPAIATAITAVNISRAERYRITSPSGITSQWSAVFNIVNVSNTSILAPLTSLSTLWLPKGTDSTFVEAASGGPQPVLASYQNPSTVVRLIFDFFVDSQVGPTPTSYSCAFRNFQLTITYAAPSPNFPALTLAP